MHEAASDLRALQQLLDESHGAAGEHLRSILTDDCRMTAEHVAELLQGVCIINLATVAASGAPIVAPIDAVFYRARLWFSAVDFSVRVRHLRARPQVSAVIQHGEQLCVIVHGAAKEVDIWGPEQEGIRDCFREVYPLWDAIQKANRSRGSFFGWIEPRRIYAAVLQSEGSDSSG